MKKIVIVGKPSNSAVANLSLTFSPNCERVPFYMDNTDLVLSLFSCAMEEASM